MFYFLKRILSNPRRYKAAVLVHFSHNNRLFNAFIALKTSWLQFLTFVTALFYLFLPIPLFPCISRRFCADPPLFPILIQYICIRGGDWSLVGVGASTIRETSGTRPYGSDPRLSRDGPRPPAQQNVTHDSGRLGSRPLQIESSIVAVGPRQLKNATAFPLSIVHCQLSIKKAAPHTRSC